MNEISTDGMTIHFNDVILPKVKNGMSSTEFSNLLHEHGFIYSGFWPLALADVGYIQRKRLGASKYIYFDADPAVPGKLRPLHKSQCKMAWEIVMKHKDDGARRYAQKLTRKQPVEGLTEESAINLLKSLGYRVMRPTTSYEEV